MEARRQGCVPLTGSWAPADGPPFILRWCEDPPPRPPEGIGTEGQRASKVGVPLPSPSQQLPWGPAVSPRLLIYLRPLGPPLTSSPFSPVGPLRPRSPWRPLERKIMRNCREGPSRPAPDSGPHPTPSVSVPGKGGGAAGGPLGSQQGVHRVRAPEG